LPNFPNIPTIAETLDGFTASGWSVMVAPHGTPPAIVQKINQDLRRALESPELVAKFREMGDYTKPMSPQQLVDYIAVQRKQWGPIVQKVATQSQ
jgi:tripartite-type tricarboxylate transporter receptor subunit TctC